MVNDKRVNLVSFTGSSAVGQKVSGDLNFISFGPNFIYILLKI